LLAAVGSEARERARSKRAQLVVHAEVDPVQRAWLSPDGTWGATVCRGGPVEIFDPGTGLLIRSVPLDIQFGFRHACPSPDGRYLAVSGLPDSPRLLDVRTGTWTRVFDHLDHAAQAVAVSRDAASVVVGDGGGRIRLYGKSSEAKWVTDVHKGSVTSVAVSADGKVIFSLGEDGMVARLSARGRLRGAGVQLGAPGMDIVCSADGSWWAARTVDGRVHVPAARGGGAVTLPAGPELVVAMAMASTGDGLVVLGAAGSAWIQPREGAAVSLAQAPAPLQVFSGAIAADGKTAVLGTRERLVLRHYGFPGRDTPLGARARSPRRASISPGGSLLVREVEHGSEGRHVEVYDLQTGWPLRGPFTTEEILGVAVSPDDRRLALLGPQDAPVRIVDVRTGERLVTFRPGGDVIGLGLFTPDGQRLLVTLADGSVEVRRADDGKLERTVPGAGVALIELDIDAEGKHVLRLTEDFVVTVNEIDTAACVSERRFREQLQGGSFVAGSSSYVVRVQVPAVAQIGWGGDLKGKTIRQIPATVTDEDGMRAAIQALDVSRDGKLLAVGGTDRRARLIELASGRVLRTFTPHCGGVDHIKFSSDGSMLVTSSWGDKTTRIHDVATGRLMAVLGSSPAPGPIVDGRLRDPRMAWFVADDEGRVDGFRFDAVDGAGWSDGERGWKLDALAAERQEPGLLARVVARRPPPPWAQGSDGPVPLPPLVNVVVPDPSTMRVAVHVENGGGGIGEVRVALNGREVVSDARGGTFAPDSAVADLSVDLSGAANLVPGATNTIEVTAYDATNRVRTRGPSVTFEAPGAPLAAPAFHAVVCGVSDYAGDALDLKYPAKDARDMASALELAATQLFGASATHVHRLGSPAQAGAVPATRENLLKALEDVAHESKANDTVVVYLAGHGVSPGGAADAYRYLTAGASSEEEAKEALAGGELVKALAAIPANHRAVILDTCAAGAVRDVLGAGAMGASEAVRYLREREGVYVLAGCAADRVSYESNVYGQGLLTYALLLGMSCGCHFTDGVYVDVARLMSFACEQVPWLCTQMGITQPQRPVKAEGEASFPLGRLDLDARTRVPLAQALPALVQASFHRVRPPTDTLLLGPAVDAAARGLGADGSKRAPIAFVDTTRMVGAYSLAGTYTITSGTAKVDAYLVRQGREEEEVIVEFRLEHAVGSPDDIAALGRMLVDRAVKEITSR